MEASQATAYKQSNFMQLVLILFLSILGTFIAGTLVQLIGKIYGLDYSEIIQNIQADSSISHKNFIKTALGVSHLFTFIIPSLVFLWIVYKHNALKFIGLDQFPKLVISLLSALWLVLAFPVVQFIYTINRNLPLPQWAIDQENLINTTIEHLLYVHTPVELFFNIFIIALLPAIGEELLFRGIVQQNLEKHSQNHHLAIWLTALIFSFIHFQFQGFLPRIFLGGLLGYLFVWTRNLWMPILAHFVYNGGQILLQYGHQRGNLGIDLNEVKVVPTWLVISGLIGTLFVGYLLFKNRWINQST